MSDTKNLFKVFIILITAITIGHSQVNFQHIRLNTKITVETIDSNIYYGRLIKKDYTFITIQRKRQITRINHVNINSIHAGYVNKQKEEFTYDSTMMNPKIGVYSSKYFFNSSAIPLKKKHGYVQVVGFTMWHVKYGITDYFSIGGMIEGISIITGQPTWALTPKFALKVRHNYHIGAGMVILGGPRFDITTFSYVVHTIGTDDNNISFGGGILGTRDETFFHDPVIQLSGSIRMNRSVLFVTENLYILDPNDRLYIGIHGFKILFRKTAINLGIIVSPVFFFLIPALPYFSIDIAF